MAVCEFNELDWWCGRGYDWWFVLVRGTNHAKDVWFKLAWQGHGMCGHMYWSSQSGIVGFCIWLL